MAMAMVVNFPKCVKGGICDPVNSSGSVYCDKCKQML